MISNINKHANHYDIEKWFSENDKQVVNFEDWFEDKEIYAYCSNIKNNIRRKIKNRTKYQKIKKQTWT